jgi:hypothetical protein
VIVTSQSPGHTVLEAILHDSNHRSTAEERWKAGAYASLDRARRAGVYSGLHTTQPGRPEPRDRHVECLIVRRTTPPGEPLSYKFCSVFTPKILAFYIIIRILYNFIIIKCKVRLLFLYDLYINLGVALQVIRLRNIAILQCFAAFR